MSATPLIGLPSLDDKWVRTPSGLIAPDATTRGYYDRLHPYAEWLKGRPIGISLFTGAGGFDLGMIQGGFHVVAALEMWPTAIMTYLTNLGADVVQMHYVSDSDCQAMNDEVEKAAKSERKGMRESMKRCKAAGHTHGPGVHLRDGSFVLDDPDRPIPPWLRSGSNRRRDWGPGCGHMWVGDARKVTGQEMLDALGLKQGEVDVVFGGPPCQGFSFAGRRNVYDSRNSLVFEFARLVTEIRPKTLVMENVPGIVSMVTEQGVPVIDELIRILEDGGMGTMTALKRSLLQSSGAGMALLKPNGKMAKLERARTFKRKTEAPTDSAPGLMEWVESHA